MSDEYEEDLLEFETEAPDDGPGPGPVPVPVVITDPVVTVETVPQHATAYTVVADANATGLAVQELLPLDPLRVRALVWIANADDPPVVICHSKSQAQSDSNTEASTPNPSGALLPPGITLALTGTQQMFVAATSDTASRVAVIIERRTP